jgi:hypothetical protein
MKIHVTVNEQRLAARHPYADADHVLVDVACPSCAYAAPLKVRGASSTHDHDTHRASAIALCCDATIGTMEVKVDTLFGIEEDRAVLNGRCRVY